VTRIRSLIVGAAVFAAFAIAPATSNATLVFTRNPLNPTVYVAKDNGSAARKIGSGSNPRVSPDGQTVVFYRPGQGKQPPRLMVVPASGGTPKIATGWQEPFVFAWSRDSTKIAVLLGPEVGKRRLTVIDVATGVGQVVARGYFGGVSFAPQGNLQLVYSMSTSESFPPRSDIYRIDLLPPGAVSVAAVTPQRLTNDHRSTDPLWGPNNRIVFVKHLGERAASTAPRTISS
jgi:Tol biopolymer transport system component